MLDQKFDDQNAKPVLLSGHQVYKLTKAPTTISTLFSIVTDVVDFEPQTIAKKKEKNQPTFKNKNLTISSYLILQLTVDDSDDYLNNALLTWQHYQAWLIITIILLKIASLERSLRFDEENDVISYKFLQLRQESSLHFYL